ncbi:MAG: TPM domain-containing protein [Rhodothermales bacterium]
MLAVLALLSPARALAQRFDVLAPTGQWVTDRGDFLSPNEERLLSQKLAAYEDSTSTQIVVVTLPDLGGADPGEYATELGRRWGVGQKGQDNGVVILASRNDRKIFIATGYGIEGAIPDAVAGRIVRNIIVPAFRDGRYYDGFSRAADALILSAKGEFEAEPRSSLPDVDYLGIIFWIVIILIIVISRSSGGGRGGKRYRSRRHGNLPLIIWGSILDDAMRQGRRGGGNWGGGGWGGGGFGGGGGGFGGFGGGGGSFGGGGAGGSW